MKNCGYTDAEDQLWDRLVIGFKNKHLKEKLQLLGDLNLKQALTTDRRAELIKHQLSEQMGMEAS